MKITLLSTLSILGLGFITSEAAVNVVRIDASKKLVCLILPPPGKIIGDTQQDGHVQCTDGHPKLLPANFFVSKEFETTANYVQAWGYMNDKSVGLLKSDGGGQYDIHKDSGTNKAEGYPVFVELLEPDSGRWCIRFCHKLGTDCNMGKSSDGCEGALGITKWPSNKIASIPSAGTKISNTTSAVISIATSTLAAGASTTSKSTTNDSVKTSFSSIVPLAILASAFYTLFL
ncbi:hypothetical protein BGX26_003287 [Mortierella sp. AD094]|nr:hypothetical protein BGX26_003287 [Mortierella sp. AD094]